MARHLAALLGLLALLLAAGPAPCAADKGWKEWYWSEFKPEAGEASGGRRDALQGPPPSLPPRR